MVQARQLITRFARDERGLTTVEYAIVLCLIAAVAVGAWKIFGENVERYLTGATDRIDEAIGKGE